MAQTDYREETDYREISQQYAQVAVKAIILVNGGSAFAILSQVTSLSKLLPLWSIGTSLILFILGVAAGSGCWIIGFLASRHVDRALRDQDYSKANKFMLIGISLNVLGILFFVFGALLLAVIFMF